ncbi:ABC transporter ATP-binding protein [Nakamurella lactea]|uniref:ABC transporter ATP-binding protein n=1 Tax=Nakamurella lactea TaxID=459515 RepID=UPI001B7FC154|nr:ABC transporter ATP-binding protein [Nakamurella lactea]
MTPVLQIEDLAVEFTTPEGVLRAVDGVSYSVDAGETLAVVGETGSGKSVTVLAALGLLDAGRIVSGRVMFDGLDLLRLPDKKLRRLLGSNLTMVFQNPMSALNPVMTVGRQVAETLVVHDRKLTNKGARGRAIELLALVGVPQPDVRFNQYPHEFSGGMCQRVVIAMAIANNPRVIIADEPTTAVDVTVQAQLLDLLQVAREETGAGVVLITHDLGVVAEVADRVAVMYAGRVVETAPVRNIFRAPQHPYTVGLLSCLPRLDSTVEELVPIPGSPANLLIRSPGCAFQPRCGLSADRDICTSDRPELAAAAADSAAAGSWAACHFADETTAWSAREHLVREPS